MKRRVKTLHLVKKVISKFERHQLYGGGSKDCTKPTGCGPCTGATNDCTTNQK